MADPSAPFDAFAVEQAIRAAAPEVLFAPPRLVRRIIRADQDLPLALSRTPHRDIAVINSRRLAEIADDVRALARHDESRCQYTAAMRAARAMGADDAADALDQIVDLTGESVEGWAARVTREMDGAR